MSAALPATTNLRPGFCYACGQHPDDMGPHFRTKVHGGAGRHLSPRPRTLAETLYTEHRDALDAIGSEMGMPSGILGPGWELVQRISSAAFLEGLRAAR